MTSNLECVGLAVHDEDAFAQLVAAVLPAAASVGRGAGVEVVRWEDPSGARLVLTLTEEGVVGLLPSFAGTGGAVLRDVSRLNDDVHSASVVDDSGEQVTALAAEFEQGPLLSSEHAGGPASVVALGVDVAVFADEEAFSAANASLLDRESPPSEPPAHYRDKGWAWPPRLAAESFISYGLFGDPAGGTAHATLAGTVLSAQRRTTVQTGQAFHAAQVQTAGFVADVCFPAPGGDAPPLPGQVVAGTVFLVASLVDAPAERAVPGPARRGLRLPWRR